VRVFFFLLLFSFVRFCCLFGVGLLINRLGQESRSFVRDYFSPLVGWFGFFFGWKNQKKQKKIQSSLLLHLHQPPKRRQVGGVVCDFQPPPVVSHLANVYTQDEFIYFSLASVIFSHQTKLCAASSPDTFSFIDRPIFFLFS
jgi:hypothetical protein